MLRDGGVPQIEEFREFSDRMLAVDQLADDEKPVAVGKRLQEIARLVGRLFHHVTVYFHTCVYTMIRIYSQAMQDGRAEPARQVKQAQRR